MLIGVPLMHMPSWSDMVELIRMPAPGDPGHRTDEPSEGRFGALVDYIANGVPEWLKPFHSIKLADGTVLDSAEIAHLASMSTFADWKRGQ